MSKKHRVFAFLFVMLFLASMATPVANNDFVSDAKLQETSFEPAETTYNVVVTTFNHLMAFNDDDFEFRVRNGTIPLNNAWVRLYNATSGLLEVEDQTDGNGYVWFYNLEMGTYNWNVSHDLDPVSPAATGQIVSDGPEASVSILFGNLDWDNDDDDLNATIRDIDGNLASNLNFSLIRVSDGSLYAQVAVVAGRADFQDIAPGNYTWRLTVLGDPIYDGYLIQENDIESNGTQLLALTSLGPLTGDPDYYDLEIFTHYETSLVPIEGADVEVTYKDGTVIDTKVTPANGTVIFVDLPVAFINVSVTYMGQPVGPGDYSWNLTAPFADIRDPTITGPGDQSVLIDSENVTLIWTVEDEYPDSIEVWVNGALNVTEAWTNTTYDYVYNVSASFPEFVIGKYEITVKAIDQNSNFVEDGITLRLYENVTPVIEGPDPVEFYYTETGYSLTWNVSDDNIQAYEITRNEQDFQNGTIDPDDPVLTISLDGLEIGVHNFTIFVNDTSDNIATNSVLVTVKNDDVTPVIVYTPADIFYAQGARNQVYNWTATDDFKDYYTIEVDGEVIVTEDWLTDDIEFDFTGLLQGDHVVTLKVYDIGGNMAESSVNVQVSASIQSAYLLGAGLISLGVIVVIGLVWFIRYR